MATSSAFQLIAETNRPEGVLSEQCLAALSANIDCLRQVETFLPGEYYSAEVLEDVCTTTCSESVLEYEAAVAAACSVGDVYLTDPTHEAPASFIATLLVYNFNRTCISDDGRWCNAVAYEGLVEPSDEATLPTFGNGTLRDRGWTRWDNASARKFWPHRPATSRFDQLLILLQGGMLERAIHATSAISSSCNSRQARRFTTVSK